MSDLAMSMFVNKTEYWKARAEEAEDNLAKAAAILGMCQDTLAILIDPSSTRISNMTAWARCVEAEAKARAILKDIGGNHADS